MEVEEAVVVRPKSVEHWSLEVEAVVAGGRSWAEWVGAYSAGGLLEAAAAVAEWNSTAEEEAAAE